ncbi:AMP-binding protein [Crocosphaera sp. UHCC 0190]|uniref:AMP-binding protein n=1 Tax=Crocosphaera sp. UHCC 0190 TaxID=3110246 RepID=UPI002B1F02C3|nr:AMP-binding protein [Crocosphaera sp. UHCC 0190]MEA5510836.1 AMP-binding protein [Crocosphaera sp. UHCC 0190]
MAKNQDFQTVREWLLENSQQFSQKKAIIDVERLGITYHQLGECLHQLVNQLNSLGIARNDVVVVSLPDGGNTLVTILGVAATAIVFPLNTNSRLEEFNYYFDQIQVSAVIVEANSSSEIVKVAKNRGICILELNCETGETVGSFRLSASAQIAAPKYDVPQLDDPLIYIGTAGSTSTPKIVSLTHKSIYISIAHAAQWMKLSEDDCSLCVMPFAHLHSIVRSTFPGLLTGGSVVCTSGFDPARMLTWINQYHPSYFTAVPSIYRALLKRIERIGWSLSPESRLRLLITGSDAINAETITQVQKVFGVPLLQFYGLSEVSPLLATLPHPSLSYPSGAVGQVNPVWTIKCLDTEGKEVPIGQEGEITVKGGIINHLVGKNIDPDGQKIREGWLQTGDLGRLDDNGFLFYTGRVDDRINRGGKKISARQLESILIAHPDVVQAVVFPVPDTIYGQKVGTAIIPKDGVNLTSQILREYLLTRVSDYQIPEYIVFTDQIPLSHAGKIQRKKLAQYFELKESTTSVLPEQPLTVDPDQTTERLIADVFKRILGLTEVKITDSFFELGGNSLTALELLHAIQTYFGKTLSIATLLENPTPQGLAIAIKQQGWVAKASGLLGIQPEGNYPPLFAFTGLWGFPTAYRQLAQLIRESDHPLWAMGNPEVDSIEEMGKICLGDMRQIQSTGPYYLMGYSFGGLLALEVTKQLEQQEEKVASVILLDPAKFRKNVSQGQFFSMVRDELRQAKQTFQQNLRLKNHPFREIIHRNLKARDSYDRPKVNTQAMLIVTQERVAENPDYVQKWLSLFGAKSTSLVLEVGHTMLDEPHVSQVAPHIKDYLLNLT